MEKLQSIYEEHTINFRK